MNTTLHPFLADGLDPQAILLIGMVLVLGSLLWHRARTRTGRTRAGRTRTETRTSRHAAMHNSRLGTQATEDIQELMVRLEELTREICGQIDTRFAKLEHVIAEAEQKLASLSAALRAPAESPGTELAGSGEARAPADDRHERVCGLASAGRPNVEIARELGMAVGEVELILSLQRSRTANTPPATDDAADPIAPSPATGAPEVVGQPEGVTKRRKAVTRKKKGPKDG